MLYKIGRKEKKLIGKIEKIFETITKIPHCSEETTRLKEHIKDFAKKCGYRVMEDEAGNVMAYGSKSRVTLQAHYDMVCIGRAPKIETVVEDGWMSAKESSLGADNGIGVAIMLHMMEEGVDADYLFTNDEEVGLVGASNLELEIRTPYLLNLDTEEYGKVYIGCAGGEDIYLKKMVDFFTPDTPGKRYMLKATAPGGHSGVNIADHLPNAITELASVIVHNSAMEIASIGGGERINAIPRGAEAVVWLPEGYEPVVNSSCVSIEELDRLDISLIKDGRVLASALFGFAHGVRDWNEELNLPQASVNLAGVEMEDGAVEIALSARAMSNDDLERVVEQSLAGWTALGYIGRREGKYPAWKPQTNDFSKKVLEIYKEVEQNASYAAIHAGLECALFAERFPSLEIASIGPTILDPHSDRERVDLKSVEKVASVVKRVVRSLS